jgi:hypothetical protein
MLVFDWSWSKHGLRSDLPDYFRQFYGMDGSELQVRVAVQIDKFNCCAQQRGGLPCFSLSFFGRTVCARFAARTHYKMRFASSARLQGNDAAATKLDVVWMRAND